MKKIFAKLFGKGGLNIADNIADIIDRFVHTREEKARMEQEITNIFLRAEAEMQKNISARWIADVNSDSWLAKNVRPLTLIFLVFSSVLLIFIDAGWIVFDVKDKWVDLLQYVLIAVISAYFGGRSFEKIRKQ